MNPTIYNVNMAIANTEYSLLLPSDAKGFMFKTRNGYDSVKLGLKSGESATNFITIPAGGTLELTEGYISGTTIYFQSPTIDVAEIVVII
jgi:hypothetical protein